ncbi:hypothetical protein AVEN_172358-1, partial [Araneus ventricosus]
MDELKNGMVGSATTPFAWSRVIVNDGLNKRRKEREEIIVQ